MPLTAPLLARLEALGLDEVCARNRKRGLAIGEIVRWQA